MIKKIFKNLKKSKTKDVDFDDEILKYYK